MGSRAAVFFLGFLVLQEKLSVVSGDLGVCMLPSDPGLCFILQERWYFNFQMKKCQPFTWGGCKANENNFATWMECEAACRRYGKPGSG